MCVRSDELHKSCPAETGSPYDFLVKELHSPIGTNSGSYKVFSRAMWLIYGRIDCSILMATCIRMELAIDGAWTASWYYICCPEVCEKLNGVIPRTLTRAVLEMNPVIKRDKSFTAVLWV